MGSGAALVRVLLTWVVLAPALVGVGLLVARAFRSAVGPLEAFWLGVAGVLVALQWWNLALPVARLALGALAAAAACGWALEGRAALRRWGRPGWRTPALAALLAGAALWLAARALGPLGDDDSGVYHLGAVRWASEHAVVPGIGNLHPLLAFNHGFFPFAALVGTVPWAPGVQHVANGLPALGFLALSLRGALELVGRPAEGRSRAAAAAAATLLPWAIWCAQSREVSTANGNLLELALGGAFVVSWAEALEREGEQRGPALRAAVFLVAALVVVKFSSAGGALGVLAAVAVASRGARLRGLAEAAGVGLLAAVPHAAGVVLRSGYWPYPGPLVAFPVDWRMPRAMVDAVDGWVLAWGRGTTAHWDVPGGWAWLPARLEALSTEYRELVVPLAVGAALLALTLMARRSATGPRAPLLALALPALGGLTFWLLTAPSLRNVGIWPQAFAALLASAAAASLQARAWRWLPVALLLVAAARTADLVTELDFGIPAPVLDAPVATGRWEENPRGTRAFVANTQLCWAAPLPCTPFLDPALELRDPDALGRGFRLRVDLETYRPATLRVLGTR